MMFFSLTAPFQFLMLVFFSAFKLRFHLNIPGQAGNLYSHLPLPTGQSVYQAHYQSDQLLKLHRSPMADSFAPLSSPSLRWTTSYILCTPLFDVIGPIAGFPQDECCCLVIGPVVALNFSVWQDGSEAGVENSDEEVPGLDESGFGAEGGDLVWRAEVMSIPELGSYPGVCVIGE